MKNLNRNDAYLATFNRSFKDVEESKSNYFTPQLKSDFVTVTAGIFESKHSIALIFEEDFDQTIQSTNFIEVRFVEMQRMPSVVFSLKDIDFLDQFVSFAIDLESELKENPKATIEDLINRYNYWVELFKQKKEVLSESSIKGMINELLLITQYFINSISIDTTISSWGGPDRMKKDFTFENGTWYEAKAVSYGKDSVTITSIEQLKSDTIGYLVIGDYEKTSPFNSKGLNLKEAVQNVLLHVKSKETEGEFIGKLKNNGFDIDDLLDDSSYVNEFRYIFKGFRFYKVDDNFPCMHKDDISSAISKIKYDLTISKLIDFKVEF